MKSNIKKRINDLNALKLAYNSNIQSSEPKCPRTLPVGKNRKRTRLTKSNYKSSPEFTDADKFKATSKQMLILLENESNIKEEYRRILRMHLNSLTSIFSFIDATSQNTTQIYGHQVHKCNILIRENDKLKKDMERLKLKL